MKRIIFNKLEIVINIQYILYIYNDYIKELLVSCASLEVVYL